MKTKICLRFSLLFAALMMFTGVICSRTAPTAQAAEAAKHSLTVTYSSAEEIFEGQDIKLWRIADVSAEWECTLAEKFKKYPVTVSVRASKAERKAMITTLIAYISADNIAPDHTLTTDENGTAKFTNLDTGMYLVGSLRIKNGSEMLEFESFTVVFPGVDEDGNILRDVSAKPKASRTEITGDEITYKVVKTWRDAGNSKKRPDSVVVEIYKDGVLQDKGTVELNSSNDWSCSWTVEDDGSVWEVIEKDVPSGYKVEVQKAGTTFTVINTFTNDDSDDEPETTTGGGEDSTTHGGDDSDTTTHGGDDSDTTTRGGDDSDTTTRGGDDSDTTTRGGDDSSTTTRGGDDSDTTTHGGDDSDTTTRGGDDSDTTTRGGDDSSTTTHGGDDSSTTTRGGDDSDTTTRGGDDSDTTTRGGDDSSTTTHGGDDSDTTTRGGDDSDTTTRGGEDSTTHGGDDSSTTTHGGDDSDTTTRGGDDSDTTTRGGDDSDTTTRGGDDSDTTTRGGDDSDTTTRGGGDSDTTTRGGDDSDTTTRGGDDSDTTTRGGTEITTNGSDPETTTRGGNSGGEPVPNTGNSSNMTLYIVLLAVSGTTLAVLGIMVLRKRNNNAE